jgi:hypothetical protein
MTSVRRRQMLSTSDSAALHVGRAQSPRPRSGRRTARLFLKPTVRVKRRVRRFRTERAADLFQRWTVGERLRATAERMVWSKVPVSISQLCSDWKLGQAAEAEIGARNSDRRRPPCIHQANMWVGEFVVPSALWGPDSERPASLHQRRRRACGPRSSSVLSESSESRIGGSSIAGGAVGFSEYRQRPVTRRNSRRVGAPAAIESSETAA